MRGYANLRGSRLFAPVCLTATLLLGTVGALADKYQDEDHRCRELKRHGRLLAQQLEASKNCRGGKSDHALTLTCLYSVEGKEIAVDSSGSGQDWESAENVGYTIKSLAPGVTLSFGKGDRTGGYPMLKRSESHGKACSYDWAWLTPDEVVIASLVADTL